MSTSSSHSSLLTTLPLTTYFSQHTLHHHEENYQTHGPFKPSRPHSIKGKSTFPMPSLQPECPPTGHNYRLCMKNYRPKYISFPILTFPKPFWVSFYSLPHVQNRSSIHEMFSIHTSNEATAATTPSPR